MAEDPGAKAARILRATAVELQKANTTALKDAAQEMKDTILAEASTIGGGRLRNVGRSGAKLGVGYDITGTTATVKARGPWGLVQKVPVAHQIRAKRRGGKKALSYGGKAFAVVNWKSKRSAAPKPWDSGIEKAIPRANKILLDRYIRAAAKAW